MNAVMRHGKARLHREIVAGIASSIEACLAFADWASLQGDRRNAQMIQNRFDCSRATSYRWFNAWQAVKTRRAA